MYLKQLKITNYKSFFETTEFNFEPGFNVLLGANSSGKTSVLEAICFHEFPNTPHRSILNVIEANSVLVDASAIELNFIEHFGELLKQVPRGTAIYIGIGDQTGHFYSQDLQALAKRLKEESLWLDFKIDHAANRSSRLSFADWPSIWRGLNGNTTFPGLQIQGFETSSLAVNNFGPGAKPCMQPKS